jgi:hypothetical protein
MHHVYIKLGIHPFHYKYIFDINPMIVIECQGSFFRGTDTAIGFSLVHNSEGRDA